jgi:hypothetical protein
MRISATENLIEPLRKAYEQMGERYCTIGQGEVFIDKATGKKLVATEEAHFVRWDYSSRWVYGVDEEGVAHSVRSLDVVKLKENKDGNI